MGQRRNLQVVAYDIADDRRRRRIAGLLEEEGTRVQFSVFEMRLSERKLQTLIGAAKEIMSDADSLRVYVCGKSGEGKSIAVGGTMIDHDVGYWLI